MTRRRRQLLNTAEDPRQAPDLDNIARFEPRRETVGELLRRTREIKGSEIETVAARLRIRAGYLKAIEGGRFQDLPGSTYAVGFVRTYADHLGLDSEDVVRRFRDEVAEVNNQTQLIFPVVAAEGKIPRGAILLLSAFLGAIAYGGWYYLSERDQSPLDLIPELPAQLRSLISGDEAPDAATSAPTAAPAPQSTAPAEPAIDQPAATAPAAPPAPADGDAASVAPPPSVPAPATEPPSATAEAEPADLVPPPAVDPAPQAAVDPAPPAAPTTTAPDSQTAAVPPPSVAAPAMPTDLPPPAPTLDSSGLPTVAAPTAGNLPPTASATDGSALPATPEGQVFGAADVPSRIVLVARLESWVQVTDPESNALLTRVLRAGDRYYVPDQPGLTLATGNLGGLDVWVDGQKMPTLGPVGVVRRGIPLDPMRLQDGTAATVTPPTE